MIYFYAYNLKNSIRTSYGRAFLNKKVIEWLSKNLRKTKNHQKRRYDYLKSSFLEHERIIFDGNESINIPMNYKSGLRYSYAIKIYNENDAIAFKMKWC